MLLSFRICVDECHRLVISTSLLMRNTLVLVRSVKYSDYPMNDDGSNKAGGNSRYGKGKSKGKGKGKGKGQYRNAGKNENYVKAVSISTKQTKAHKPQLNRKWI